MSWGRAVWGRDLRKGSVWNLPTAVQDLPLAAERRGAIMRRNPLALEQLQEPAPAGYLPRSLAYSAAAHNVPPGSYAQSAIAAASVADARVAALSKPAIAIDPKTRAADRRGARRLPASPPPRPAPPSPTLPTNPTVTAAQLDFWAHNNAVERAIQTQQRSQRAVAAVASAVAARLGITRRR